MLFLNVMYGPFPLSWSEHIFAFIIKNLPPLRKQAYKYIEITNRLTN